MTGVDVSPHMLAIAREKLAREGEGTRTLARLLQGDVRTADLGEQFDLAIIAVKSFVYLRTREEQLQALCNVARHLRAGGLLAMDLLNPDPRWLLEEAGTLRQDLVEHVRGEGYTVARTEAVVSIDLAAQIRIIRSIYEMVADDGSVTKRFVEWPFRYTFRFEAEHLLERAGFEIEAVYGGYQREPFTSDSRVMLFLARKI
jgi:SAM-dependent methyltransferase